MPPDTQDRRAIDPAITALQRDMAAIKKRLDVGADRMDGMQDELTRNTEVTTEVREILSAVRSGLKVLGGLGTLAMWVGKLAAAAAAISAAWYAFTHGNTPGK